MKSFFLPYLEWEVLRKRITVSKVDDREELPKGQKKIVVDRDEDYNLRATLHFKDPTFMNTYKPEVAGSFSETFDIHGSYLDAIDYTLESCVIEDTAINHNIQDQEILGTAELHSGGFKTRHQNEKEGTHLTEWYLNGPKDLVFSRLTDRKLVSSFSRERFVADQKIDSIQTSLESGGRPRDFLQIKTNDFQFLVTKVPNEVGPEWSSNIGIEYRKAWGRIPERSEREKIEELCSFVFGRQLLSVGYTTYDENEKLVEEYARSPWGRKARSYCSKPDQPPIRIDNGSRGTAETIISQLLSTYYEMQKPLRLKEALWNYWVSRHVPVGTNLSMLAAALESVINGWFEHNKSKSKGIDMEKGTFETLLKDEIEGMRKKLQEHFKAENPEEEFKVEQIIDRVLRAYEFGIMERYRVFFKEVVLPINDFEWKAIQERHKFVHGHILFDTADWKQVIQHVNTFETLFHKVLLRLLGYSGTFIDRSVLGWNDKQLS